MFAFSECAEPADRLAARIGCGVGKVDVHRFPDGESLIRVEQPAPTVLLYRSLNNPNAKLIELLLAAAALRDNGASRVMLIAPYLGYMRQDMAFETGQAISQRVIGALLASCFDGVLTVDPHLHRVRTLTEVMPGTSAVSLSAAPALAAAIDTATKPVLIGPDAESRQWVEEIARPLGLAVLIGSKVRLNDCEVNLSIPDIERLRGRCTILVDDLISSGGTLLAAAGMLRAAGASRIEALCTHCLADDATLARLLAAGIDKLRATDSIAGPASQIELAGLLAQAIRQAGWLGDAQ